VNLDEVCDRCGAPLDGPTVIENLVRMQNVTLDPAKRITCDEEERQRFGYRLVTAYRFPEVDGKFDRRDAEVVLDGHSLMQLSYGDATDLFRINQGWLNQDPAEGSGFLLDLERGFWAANRNDTSDEEDPTAGRRMRVVPYVQDTKNALVLRFSTSFPDAEMAGLQSAFKEAIQKLFQIEPRELASEALPSPRDRREILFYESSEGGAGVLRQLVDNPDVVPRLARLALEICHFDPVTLEDRKPHLCGKACYECLLDYFNQPDHLLLDRYLIRNHLAELARANCRPAGGAGSRGERLAALRQRCDSALETRWLDLLERLLLRLPSDAQHALPQYHTKPDFFYRDDNTAIYIDGPVHDDPSQRREDEAINRRLMEAGFVVLRFHHAADWNALLVSHPDIFGTPQS
jgi:very-short-patch-repair endonuclease